MSDDTGRPSLSGEKLIRDRDKPSRLPVMRCARWALVVVCQFTAGGLHAGTPDAGAEDKFVSGRLGIGELVDPRYSGSARYGTFPVPLASLRFGDYAYIDYWQ